MSVSLRLRGDIRARCADLGDATSHQLHKTCCVETESRHQRGPQWLPPPSIDLARYEDGVLVLPRGATDLVRETVGASVTWVDERVSFPRVDAPVRREFRPNQTSSADVIEARHQAIVLGATGSGKAGAIAATIARLGQPARIVVPTVDLAVQMKREIGTFLDVPIAVMTGGDFAVDFVTIMTPQTAIKHAAKLDGLFGYDCFDELQNFATEQRARLIGTCSGRYRAGFTATLPDDEPRRRVLRLLFGRVAFSYGIAEATAAGVLMVPRRQEHRTSFRFDYRDADDYGPMLEALALDAARNAQIVDTVAASCTDRLGLVLTGRVKHALDLAESIRGRGLRCEALVGEMPKRERVRVLDAARAGDLDVVTATNLADEGLDVPTLAELFLVFPARGEAKLLQRIGRVLRVADGKHAATVHDFIDESCGVLRHQARIRAQLFDRTWHAQTSRCA